MSVEAYQSAGSVEEAVAAMAAGARVVAGGTDLVVGARQGKMPLPSSLVAIHGLDELRGIAEQDGAIRFGALATHADVVASAVVRNRLTALADASAIVGSHATRAHGTLGGNLMNASPAMETGGPLMCFAATARLRSADGSREVEVEDLFAAPGETVAAPGELLAEIVVPEPAAGTGSCYLRLEYRRQMEIAVVGATAVRRRLGQRSSGGTCGDHRARPDDPPCAGGRSRPGRERRRARGRRGRSRRGRRGGEADLGRARLRALPPRNGRGDH